MNKQQKTVLSFFSQNEKRDEKAMMKQTVEENRGKERGGEEGWFAERQNTGSVKMLAVFPIEVLGVLGPCEWVKGKNKLL